MFSATFFFLGVSFCIFAGIVCYSLAKSAKAGKRQEMPADEKAAWEQLKTAIYDLHSRYESTETPKQRVLRSWAGTCIICAGLCLIGVVLEAEYDKLITPESIFASWVRPTTVACQQVHPTKPATKKTQKQTPAATTSASAAKESKSEQTPSD